jgi:hypothetical protein
LDLPGVGTGVKPLGNGDDHSWLTEQSLQLLEHQAHRVGRYRQHHDIRSPESGLGLAGGDDLH